MLVLGIESSCDDTSVALVDCSDRGHVIIAEKMASQIDIHTKYGGVVPEIAGRMHAEKIVPLIEEVMNEGNKEIKKQGNSETVDKLIHPDVIAVTAGPGLITGLIVGVEAARTLSYAWNIPLIAVNHIEGHIHSVEISNNKFQISSFQSGNANKIQNPKSKNDSSAPYSLLPTPLIDFPALCLVVSGGHTELISMKDHGDYKILGSTKDDAAGECFDKVAKLLGLPYPGGPQISRLAMSGRTDAINFPRPMLKEKNFDFSFAGLKTAALYWLRDNAQTDSSTYHLPPTGLADFCASFEQAIVDVLVGKALRAAEEIKPKTIILAGGVAANKKLRETLGAHIQYRNSDEQPFAPIIYLLPTTSYAMDNGAMIAVAGYYHAIKKEFTDWDKITVDPNWKIEKL